MSFSPLMRGINSLLILVSLTVLNTAFARSPLDGQITVKNTRNHAVTIHVDNHFAGFVQPQAKRVFNDIPNGVRLVQVRGLDAAVTERVQVPVSGNAYLRVREMRGVGQIINQAKVRVSISIDGRRIRTLSPGQTLKTEKLRAGDYQVTARSLEAPRGPGRILPQRQTLRIEAGGLATVHVTPFFADLSVTNSYGRRASLWVDGQRIGRIGANATLTLSRLAPGMHTVQLRKRGRIIASDTLNLAAAQTAHWSPRRIFEGAVRVTNTGRRSVVVSLDDSASRTLAPGQVTLFTNVAPGRANLIIERSNGRQMTRSVRVPRRGVADFSVGGRKGPRIQVGYRNHRGHIASL